MLEVRGERPVPRDHGPTVLELEGFVASDVEHRFDRERHSRPQENSPVRVSMVGDVRLFPHVSADAMTAVLADETVAPRKRELLDRVSDRAKSVARPRLFNA